MFKDVPQLCLCAAWPRRPAGYNKIITIPHMKAILALFCPLYGIAMLSLKPTDLRVQVAHKHTKGMSLKGI